MPTLIEMAKRNTPTADPIYKKVISVRPEGAGHRVKLACGHTSWWVIAPAVGLAHPCTQCVNALLEHARKERGGNNS